MTKVNKSHYSGTVSVKKEKTNSMAELSTGKPVDNSAIEFCFSTEGRQNKGTVQNIQDNKRFKMDEDWQEDLLALSNDEHKSERGIDHYSRHTTNDVKNERDGRKQPTANNCALNLRKESRPRNIDSHMDLSRDLVSPVWTGPLTFNNRETRNIEKTAFERHVKHISKPVAMDTQSDNSTWKDLVMKDANKKFLQNKSEKLTKYGAGKQVSKSTEFDYKASFSGLVREKDMHNETLKRPDKNDVFSFQNDDEEEFSFEKFDKQVLVKRQKTSFTRVPNTPHASHSLRDTVTMETEPDAAMVTGIDCEVSPPGEDISDSASGVVGDIPDHGLPFNVSNTPVMLNKQTRLSYASASESGLTKHNVDNDVVPLLKKPKWEPVDNNIDTYKTQQLLDPVPTFSSKKPNWEPAAGGIYTSVCEELSVLETPTIYEQSLKLPNIASSATSSESAKSTNSAEVMSHDYSFSSAETRDVRDGGPGLYIQNTLTNNYSAVHHGARVWARDISERTEEAQNPLEVLYMCNDTVDGDTSLISAGQHNGYSDTKETCMQPSVSKVFKGVNGLTNGRKVDSDVISVSFEQSWNGLSSVCNTTVSEGALEACHNTMVDKVTDCAEGSEDQSDWNQTLKHFILQNLECDSIGDRNKRPEKEHGPQRLVNKRPSVEEKMAEEVLLKKLDFLRNHSQSYSSLFASQIPSEPACAGENNQVLDLSNHHAVPVQNMTSCGVMATVSPPILDLSDNKSNMLPAVVCSANNGEITSESPAALQHRLSLSAFHFPHSGLP